MLSASAIVASRFRPFSKPSLAMSVKMIAAIPASSNRRAMSSADTSDVSAQPSTATLPSRASRPSATPRKRPGGFLDQNRIAHRGRADDDARNTLAEPGFDRFQFPNAAAELNRQGNGFQDPLNRIRIHGLTGERAVEIDHMQILEALCGECARLLRGIKLKTVARAISPCSRRTH